MSESSVFMNAFSEWALANPDACRTFVDSGTRGPGYGTSYAAIEDWARRQERYYTPPKQEPEDIFESSLSLLNDTPPPVPLEAEPEMPMPTYFITTDVQWPPEFGKGIVTFRLEFGLPPPRPGEDNALVWDKFVTRFVDKEGREKFEELMNGPYKEFPVDMNVQN